MKAGITILMVGLLAGCTTQPDVAWEQGEQVTIAQSSITLNANLWQNHMVGVGLEDNAEYLHGSLYLSSEQDLPAGLDVTSVILKQPEQEWILRPQDFEIRVHDEQQWEVAFKTRTGFETDQPVDILLILEHQGKIEHLVARQVAIDIVH